MYAPHQESSMSLQAIHEHFVRDSSYGHFISDSAPDTGPLTSIHSHILHTSQQQVLVNGCHPTLTKSYFLAISGMTTINPPTGPILVLVGQHEILIYP